MKRLPLIAITSLAFAFTAGHAGHGGKDCHADSLHALGHSSPAYLEKLAAGDRVSDAQRTKLRALADKHRPNVRQYGDALRQAGADLRAAMQSDTPDPEAIRAAAEAKGRATGELMVIGSQIRTALRSILPKEEPEPYWKRHHERGELDGKKGEQGADGKPGSDGAKGEGDEKAPAADKPSERI